MVYVSGMAFDRSTSDVPGKITATSTNRLLFYAPHPSGQCSIAVWWPSASYTNANWLVMVRGGLGYNPGERSTYDLSSYGAEAIADYFCAQGYVVFAIDYPGNASNRDDGLPLNDIRPLAQWPDAIFWCATALQFIRDNFDSTTPFGARLLGQGNSIDPVFGTWYGNSWGGTIGAMLALMPDWMLTRFASPGLRRSGWQPRSSHRLKAWMLNQAQIDLTQFDIEPSNLTQKPTYALGEIYMNDRAQWLMRTDGKQKWSTTPLEVKKVSPWWMLQRNYPENADVGFYCRWPANPGGQIAEEANLTSDYWRPGVVPTAADRTARTAWRDPHHLFQARPWRDALHAYGTDPNALIRKSVVRWGNASGSGVWANPGSFFQTNTNFAAAAHEWLQAHAGFPY